MSLLVRTVDDASDCMRRRRRRRRRRSTQSRPMRQGIAATIGNRTQLNRSMITITGAALLLLFPFGLAACGGPEQDHPSDGGDGDAVATILTIVANEPIDGTTDVPINGTISATFSDEMDAGSLTASTFTLTVGPTAVPVDGTVIYANAMAVFVPATNLGATALSDLRAKTMTWAFCPYLQR